MPFAKLPAGRCLSNWLPLLLLLATGCSKPQTLVALFQKTTPHDDYARALDRAGLREAALGRRWQQVAEQALRDSLPVTLPVAETGYFRAEQPTAASYRYAVRAGEQVLVRLTLAAGPVAAPRVFVDAFALAAGQPPTLLKWSSTDTTAAGTDAYHYQAQEDGQHLLRVQPELLATGRYTLQLWRGPGLGLFPVRGRTDAAIGSVWGDGRDNNTRRHEGVDIMAPRGTPAVAATSGTITRTGETELGGRVVWLADAATGQHLYYAHLDRQLVQPGQRVQAGDTLGLVGNTGNARTTAPHLHFGIYRAGRGAIDPLPFLRRADAVPPAPAGPDRGGEWVRPRKAGAGLAATTPLLVLGQQPGRWRVATPLGSLRYVAARAVAPAHPLRRLRLSVATELQVAPLATAPAVASWPAGTAVAVLGQSGGYSLLSATGRQAAWARLQP